MAAISGALSTRFAVAGIALASLGCLGEGRVTRVFDGRTESGPMISPDAYSSFLEGVIAFEAAKYDQAISAYRMSIRSFDGDPNVWAHLAKAICAAKKGDGAREIRVARDLDASFSGASFAESFCAARAGNIEKESAALSRGRGESPSAPLPARAFGHDENSERVLAATLFRANERGAWRALAEWSDAHGERGLEVRAWHEWLARDGGAFEPATHRVHSLLRKGEVAIARSIARSMIESDTRTDGKNGIIGVLAVDELLTAGADPKEVERIAIRGNVPPEEVAVRAFALGERAFAERQLETRLAAGDGSPTLAWLAALSGFKSPDSKNFATRAPDSLLLISIIAGRIGRVDREAARKWIVSVGLDAENELVKRVSDDPLIEREQKYFRQKE